jgi:hypothetical protein
LNHRAFSTARKNHFGSSISDIFSGVYRKTGQDTVSSSCFCSLFFTASAPSASVSLWAAMNACFMRVGDHHFHCVRNAIEHASGSLANVDEIFEARVWAVAE